MQQIEKDLAALTPDQRLEFVRRLSIFFDKVVVIATQLVPVVKVLLEWKLSFLLPKKIRTFLIIAESILSLLIELKATANAGPEAMYVSNPGQ